ncbi:hypothetical protein T11_11609 [Trichinella zimbabwensis]|uniref:Retrovirus-related Pol polyprotein from type-1 retrotransposable element n=1 Tax=Trichinella zimbabwensis TaxID=268475 RepID=A0A0V1I1Q0_9BILA|nr:hypothetical protein T11_11609 [Trichinella zimbabwensis]
MLEALLDNEPTSIQEASFLLWSDYESHPQRRLKDAPDLPPSARGREINNRGGTSTTAAHICNVPLVNGKIDDYSIWFLSGTVLAFADDVTLLWTTTRVGRLRYRPCARLTHFGILGTGLTAKGVSSLTLEKRSPCLVSTPDANSRKAWLIDSIIRGGVKEILHSTKARISNDFFSIPCRDGGLGLTSRVLKFRAFSMPKALGRMADSSDPVSKRIAVFFRGEDAPSMKTFEATQKTFRNRRKARYGMTYQGRRFPEFQESTGNAWLRSGRARGRAPLPLDVKIAEAVD